MGFIIVWLLLVILLLILAIMVYFFWFTFVRWKPRYQGDFDDKIVRQYTPFKKEILAGKNWIHDHRDDRVELMAEDGLMLAGYYIPSESPSCNTMLLMHGYRSDGYSDFCCLAEFYHKNGFNLLIAHERAHGESEGKFIGFGVLERYDCKKWIEYLNTRFSGRHNIYLSGVSMGCAAVLMSLNLNLPSNVKAAIADCGFTSPWDIFEHIIKKDIHLPVFPFLYLEDFLCKKALGFGLKDCSTVDVLKENEIPVLFIHGEEDDFVPVWMGKKNYEACKGEKELLIVKKAKHANSSMQDPAGYRRTVLAFLKKYQ